MYLLKYRKMSLAEKKNKTDEINEKQQVRVFKILFKSTLEVFKSNQENNKSKTNNSLENPFKSGEKVTNDFDLAYKIYSRVKVINIPNSVLICAFMYIDKLISANRDLLSIEFFQQ